MDIGEALELLDKQKKLYLKYRALFDEAKDKRIRMRSLVVAKQLTIDRREAKIEELENEIKVAVYGKDAAEIIQKLEDKNKRLSDRNEDLNRRLRERVLGEGERIRVKVEPESLADKFLQGKM